MRKLKLLFVLLSFPLFYSCNSGSDKTEKFVGKWRDLKSQKEITISKSGNNFIISGQGDTYPASYNKELDKLEVNAEMQHVEFIYDSKSKHLIGPNVEFEKVK